MSNIVHLRRDTDRPFAPAQELNAIETRLIAENSPFALENVTVGGVPYRGFRHAPKTLGDIYRKARSLRQTPLLLADGHRKTYGEIFQDAARLATFLSGRFGVGPRDRVAIALENGSDWIVSFIAVTALGGCAVLIGTRDVSSTERHSLNYACKLVISDLVDGVAAIITVESQGFGPALSLQSCMTGQSPCDFPPVSIDPDQTACIAFTSGSTGEPKGAMLTHRGITTGLYNMLLAGAQSSANRPRQAAPRRPVLPCVLVLAPLSHVSAYSQLLLMLMAGGKLVIDKGSDTDALKKLIATEKITSITGISVAGLWKFLEDIDDEDDLSSLTALNVSGAALKPRLAAAVTEKLPNVAISTGYGMTETNGSVCAISDSEATAHPGAAGRLLPTVDCKITSEAGAALEPGNAGEIWLRGAMLMRGYCGRERDLVEGWFKTGDVGFLSSDRYLHILDRKKRFIHFGSLKVSCLEIETIVENYPGIAEAAVCTAPEQQLITSLHIALIAAPSVNTKTLSAHLQEHLPVPQLNMVFRTFADFPRTRTGKVDHSVLRTWLSQVTHV